MMFDSTGKLTWAPNNLLLYSNDFTDAEWTKAGSTITPGISDPFGGTNASTLTATAGNGQLYTNTYTIAASTAIQAIWVKARNVTGQITLRDSAANQIAITPTGSWTQIYNVSTPAATSRLHMIITNSGDSIDIYGATSSAVTYETSPRSGDQVITTGSIYYGPRFDYNPVGPAARGLLIEEGRTNLALASSGFSAAPWNVAWCGTVSQDQTGPDGVANSATLVNTASMSANDDGGVSQGTFSGNTVYSYTVYAKQGASTPLRYISLGVGTATAWFYGVFDIQTGASTANGASGTSTVTAASIESVGGGWYRLRVSGTTTTAAQYLTIGHCDTGTPTIGSYSWPKGTTLSANTKYILYGAQLEVASFATSYIPTTTGSVTRAADSVAAALYTSDSVTEYYRNVSDLTQSSTTRNPFSGISAETNVWIEKVTKP
jgi:hypothetical protein